MRATSKPINGGMQLLFRFVRAEDVPVLAAALAALVAQFVWLRLAVVVLALLLARVGSGRLGPLVALLLLAMLVPAGGPGVTPWILAADVLVAGAQMALGAGRARYLVAAAALLCHPSADSTVTRAAKTYAALVWGVLQPGETVQLVTLFLMGPLYAVYGVVRCGVLASSQVEVVHL